MATELNYALRYFDRNEKVNVIVINAKGKNFCKGIDVNYISDKYIENYLGQVDLMEEINLTIADMNKPVI